MTQCCIIAVSSVLEGRNTSLLKVGEVPKRCN